jgi:translation initiation factor IF-3
VKEGGSSFRKQEVRVNHQIRISPIRLIGPQGEQIGIIPTREALERAREVGLDLVEVSPMTRPPVCRIMDYGKYKYNQPKIEEHDYQFKMRHVRAFLLQGNKVKCFVLFRGREKAHTEFGLKILDRLAADLQEIATMENKPKLEGQAMTMLLAPVPGSGQKAGKAKAAVPVHEAAPTAEADEIELVDALEPDESEDEPEE